MARQNFFDRTETAPGYARAVRVNDQIHVSGTTALDMDGRVVGSDAYAQTREIYRKLAQALAACGATLADVVRITAYITDMSQSEGFLRAHQEVFAAISPAAALIGVSALVKPELIVEIEAYAIAGATIDVTSGP